MPVSVKSHPNIALIKYWGKQDVTLRIPSTPSLSITLGDLHTQTTVEEAKSDQVILDDQIVEDRKISQWLEYCRGQFDLPPVSITSKSNFPHSCGLASSASGFAALACAINEFLDLNLLFSELAKLARMGSVSAARSLLGGFVGLDPDVNECTPYPIQPANHWDLELIVAVTDVQKKKVSSTAGMAQSASTASVYGSWLTDNQQYFKRGKQAVNSKDFTELSEAAKDSWNLLYSVWMTTEPPLIYASDTTKRAMGTVEQLQEQGVDVFFTTDAGPQLKAICPKSETITVERALKQTPGVLYTLGSEIGGAPTVSKH